MKKIILTGLMVFFLGLNMAYAQFWKKPAESKPLSSTQAQRAIATQSAAQDELLAKKRAELNNTEWNVTMAPMNGKGRAEADTLSFANDKVVSKNLAAGGFGPSNFTLRMQDDGTVTWETMQSSEKQGIAFWRGDLKDGIMRGVLSKRDKNNNSSDFSFVSVVDETKKAAVETKAAAETTEAETK